MAIALDIILLVVLIIMVIRHTVLGFIKSIFTTLKTILAIGIAFALRVPVARLFDSLFMNKAITQWVYNSISSHVSGEDPTFNIASLYADHPNAFNVFLEKFGLETEGLEDQLANIEQLKEEAIVSLSDNIGSSISYACSLAIALVVVFIVSLLALSLLVLILDLIAKLPVINFLNRVLGAVIGVFWTFFIAWALGTVLGIVSTFLPNVIAPEIITDGSFILGMLNKMGVLSLF